MKTVEEFAKQAGCVVSENPSPEGWGGKWQYHSVDYPNCFFCGYRTQKLAYKAFLQNTFGETASKALLELLRGKK